MFALPGGRGGVLLKADFIFLSIATNFCFRVGASLGTSEVRV